MVKLSSEPSVDTVDSACAFLEQEPGHIVQGYAAVSSIASMYEPVTYHPYVTKQVQHLGSKIPLEQLVLVASVIHL